MNPLQNFRLARYHIILTALSTIVMPPYAGSTLRGGFGHAFRKMVCTQGPIDCRDCTLKAVCPYPYIFETAPFEGATQLRTYGDVPRPFVIDPLSTRGEYRRGESFVFRLTLVGRAIDYLPYFLVSFRELGEIGIGKGRGRFQLTHVQTDGGESIYDGETQMVHNLNNALSFDEIQREAAGPTNRPVDRAPAHPHANYTQGTNNGSTPVPPLLATINRTNFSVGIFPLWRITKSRF